MEWSKKINDELTLDGKDFSLLVEDGDFYLMLIIVLECSENMYQFPLYKDIARFFSYDNELYLMKKILVNLKKVYQAFKITNYNLYINHYDKYCDRLRLDIESETDAVSKAKKVEILKDFSLLDPYVGKSKSEETRFALYRDSFNYEFWFKAFNYMKDDITIFFDMFPSLCRKRDINDKLKILFDNIMDISKEFSTSIGYEIEKSKDILLELSEWRNTFKMPFAKIGSFKWINLVRLMKYWEISWYIEVSDWLGDKDGWSIKMIKQKENGQIEYFLEKINHLRNLAREWVLETRKEQDLISEIRGFDYESATDDEIFLLKTKKLKAHPQTPIWSTRDSRWFSAELSPCIIEWEGILNAFYQKNQYIQKSPIEKENYLLKHQVKIVLEQLDKERVQRETTSKSDPDYWIKADWKITNFEIVYNKVGGFISVNNVQVAFEPAEKSLFSVLWDNRCYEKKVWKEMSIENVKKMSRLPTDESVTNALKWIQSKLKSYKKNLKITWWKKKPFLLSIF